MSAHAIAKIQCSEYGLIEELSNYSSKSLSLPNYVRNYEMIDVSLKARNLKSIGNDFQGFSSFKPINLVIGKNNTGKSTLLDLVNIAVDKQTAIPENMYRDGKKPEIFCESLLIRDRLEKVFPPTETRPDVPGHSLWQFGTTLVGLKVGWLQDGASRTFVSLEDYPDGKNALNVLRDPDSYKQPLVNASATPFDGRVFRRLSADRDIVPEGDGVGVDVDENGRGATNVIQSIINKVGYPSELVEETLLHSLNDVFAPDTEFTDIVVQLLTNNTWEVFLEEANKGRIALSQSGSGLKTVLLVLIFVHLLPKVARKDLKDYIFGFEELENNLHPALLRRLLSYLMRTALDNGCYFVLTTHSNVPIDLFNKTTDAQILHVLNNNGSATCKTVETYIDNRGVLDDLDIRASDVLQSNGIVWVEGPSDRVYFNSWVRLWSGASLFEGNHYQCMFYGGRLLAHLTCEDPTLVEEGISLLNLNRNAIVLIDSDKRKARSRVADTKKRIVTEIENIGGYSWITKGREIENYVPADSIARWLDSETPDQVDPYSDFFDYLDEVKSGLGSRYSRKKAVLAEELAPLLAKKELESILDMSERMKAVCSEIRKWNGIES